MPPASTKSRQYWLFKSEPTCFSIQDLASAKDQTTYWDGVRNYQARNMLRDLVRIGDRVLYYHSNCDPLAIVGTAEVVKPGYADHTALDKKQDHYDPKSSPENPIWYMVDIRLIQIFQSAVTREMLQQEPDTEEMVVLQKGSRLSIQPVTSAEWRAIHRLAGAKER